MSQDLSSIFKPGAILRVGPAGNEKTLYFYVFSAESMRKGLVPGPRVFYMNSILTAKEFADKIPLVSVNQIKSAIIQGEVAVGRYKFFKVDDTIWIGTKDDLPTVRYTGTMTPDLVRQLLEEILRLKSETSLSYLSVQM